MPSIVLNRFKQYIYEHYWKYLDDVSDFIKESYGGGVRFLDLNGFFVSTKQARSYTMKSIFKILVLGVVPILALTAVVDQGLAADK